MSDQEAVTTVETRTEAEDTAEKPELALPDGVNLEEPVEPDWTARDDDGELITPFPIEFFGNRIVIKRDDIADRTDGGLFLPESARHSKFRTMVGTCVATGPGVLKADGTHGVMPIKVGQRVVFEKFRSMIEVKVNGFLYHIMMWTDLLGHMGAGATSRTSETVIEPKITGA